MKKFFRVLYWFLVGLLFLFCIKNFSNKEIEILYIKNKTDENFKDVQLIYSNGEVISLGELSSKGKIKHKIIADKESSITLSFYDKDGNKNEQVVVGYVFKGIKNAKVKIKKSKNGIEIITK